MSRTELALSFGSVADAYARGRPGWPQEPIDVDRLKRERGGAWPGEWDGHFAHADTADQEEVATAYRELVDAFAGDLVRVHAR